MYIHQLTDLPRVQWSDERPSARLAEVALDGLPKRAVVKATPLLTDYVATYRDFGCRSSTRWVQLPFPNAKRLTPLKPDLWRGTFRRTCALPNVRIHYLRHSFASAAIMANAPLAVIGKLLGHLLPETTDKYAYPSDHVIADAAQRISGSLARGVGLRA